MTPKEIIAYCPVSGHAPTDIGLAAELLRYLSRCVIGAQLNNGSRVLDASDVRVWLAELAEETQREAA